MNEYEQATAAVHAARRQLSEAVDERADLLRQMKASGVTWAAIAETCGIVDSAGSPDRKLAQQLSLGTSRSLYRDTEYARRMR